MMELLETAPTFDDPIGMLKSCHRRIERALEIIERVAAREREGMLDAEAREALRRTLHYFGTGVPRHAADEEESLFPRLRAAVNDRARATTTKLDVLEREHVEAHAAHQELDELGETLLETGRFADPQERARFNALIVQLRQLYREHIRVEDNELFMLAAELVEPAELDAIGTEMAQRRGIDRRQHQSLVAELQDRPWRRRSSA